MSKRKGSAAERELLHKLWERGFAVVRAAGSGSMKWPCPDLMAVIHEKNYAIECKATSKSTLYISESQIEQLQEFAGKANAIPVIAIKFLNKGWRFFDADKKQFRFKEGRNSIFQRRL